LESSDYVFATTAGTPFVKQLEMIFGEWHEKIPFFKDTIYDILLNDCEHEFFEGVPEKIQDLSQSYTLFLTTWNSTAFAIKTFQKGNILNCFAKVLGSELILKWKDHLQLFAQYSGDEEFYKNAVYIGDGPADRLFAQEAGIDFIHIGNEKKDRYEITTVADIEWVLEIL
jgi:phosphoglycolate phosphatase-like HAD superfamily hydrolase